MRFRINHLDDDHHLKAGEEPYRLNQIIVIFRFVIQIFSYTTTTITMETIEEVQNSAMSLYWYWIVEIRSFIDNQWTVCLIEWIPV